MPSAAPRVIRLPALQASRVALLGIFALWLAVVGYGVYHHVMWRDEVRALTLTLQAPNLLAVPQFVQGEGHPVLWYLLLRVAYDVFHTTDVLSGVSLAFASLGVGLFLWKAPFPTWWKAIFTFSGLAVFEYAVMAREYSLIMPLFFGLTIAVSQKTKRYWLISVLIFLTMQVDIYTTLLAPLFLLVLARDWRMADRSERLGLMACGASALVGFVASVATVYPPKHGLVTDAVSGQLSRSMAIWRAVTAPGGEYSALLLGHEHLAHNPLITLNLTDIGPLRTALATFLLYGACIGLLPDVVLLACALLGLWVTTGFALLIYPMYYRHTGVWLVFLVCLYWIRTQRSDASSSPMAAPPFGPVSWGILTVILVLNLDFGIPDIIAYGRAPSSNSRALAQRIASDPALHDAIIIPDPGEIAESLPKYSPNPIYMIRERKFGKLANWTRGSVLDLDIEDLLNTSRRLQQSTGKPIIIVIRDDLEPGSQVYCIGFNRSLYYGAAGYNDFVRSTRPIPLGLALDERFNAYLLTAPRPSPALNHPSDHSGTSLEGTQIDHVDGTESSRRLASLQCRAHPRAHPG